mmetsp:Transcript_8548/g.24318  ORF Transcript_8548/g.24318 Transcript_8548/m.24318 type:complete len:253 (-) Transcript_8548:158-916(-)
MKTRRRRAALHQTMRRRASRSNVRRVRVVLNSTSPHKHTRSPTTSWESRGRHLLDYPRANARGPAPAPSPVGTLWIKVARPRPARQTTSAPNRRTCANLLYLWRRGGRAAAFRAKHRGHPTCSSGALRMTRRLRPTRPCRLWMRWRTSKTRSSSFLRRRPYTTSSAFDRSRDRNRSRTTHTEYPCGRGPPTLKLLPVHPCPGFVAAARGAGTRAAGARARRTATARGAHHYDPGRPRSPQGVLASSRRPWRR